jgi:cold shock CspA family protein
LEGIVRKLIWDRGFGFITAEDGKDVFFHHSSLSGGDFNILKQGVSVEFDLEDGPKGQRAVNVKISDTSHSDTLNSDTLQNKEGGEPMEAYCMKCRGKKEMKNTKGITMKNGRPATQGVCPTCGTKMFRIGKS